MREALKRVRMGDDSTEEFPILDHLSYRTGLKRNILKNNSQELLSKIISKKSKSVYDFLILSFSSIQEVHKFTVNNFIIWFTSLLNPTCQLHPKTCTSH